MVGCIVNIPFSVSLSFRWLWQFFCFALQFAVSFFFSICKTNQVKPLPRAPSFWAHSARWHMPWTWIHNPLHAKCAHSCFHFHHARSPHWWWSEASRSCSLVKVENGVPKLNSLEFRSPWKFAQCEHCTNSKNTRKWPKRKQNASSMNVFARRTRWPCDPAFSVDAAVLRGLYRFHTLAQLSPCYYTSNIATRRPGDQRRCYSTTEALWIPHPS